VNVYSEVGKEPNLKCTYQWRQWTLEVQDLELPMGHKELILVVDDETAICEITKTSLETLRL